MRGGRVTRRQNIPSSWGKEMLYRDQFEMRADDMPSEMRPLATRATWEAHPTGRKTRHWLAHRMLYQPQRLFARDRNI
jgi:hypothetical protein